MPSGIAPWLAYVLACATAVAAYFVLPSTIAQNVAFIASNLVGAGAILAGVRSHRPDHPWAWRLLCAYTLCTAGGNAIWLLYDSVLHIAPFPSPGDALFLGGYLVEAAGLLVLVRARTPGRDLAALTDAAIITTGFAVASWVFLMSPLAHDPSLTVGGRLTALGYPAADLLVLLIGSRLLVAGAKRTPAFGLLTATLTVQLIADTIFALLNLEGSYHTGHPVDALILTYNLGLGAVALHPSMSSLSRPLPLLGARVSGRRLAVLTVTSLLAPGVLFGQILTGHNVDLIVTAGGGVVLFLLVVLRMAGLVHTLDKTLASREALERELEHLVHHDPLTGLANRRLLTERMTRALDPRTDRTEPVALLFIDLDDFKQINDRLGHAAGDALLAAIAGRLRGCTRADALVARVGGDEFAILLDDPDPASASTVADRVLAALRAPVAIGDSEITVTASVGIAHANSDDTLERLLRYADTAMYAAKTSGKDNYEVFNDGDQLVAYGRTVTR
jgi:diguanylate cyclase (GGDEF)-like protein